MFDHDSMDSQLAAWVLDALEPDESASVAAHVEGCSDCRPTASRLHGAVNAIALSVDEVAPPERLRQRILAAAQASPNAAREAPAARRWRAVRRRGGARRWTFRLGRSVPPAYAVAAVVAIALLGGVVLGEQANRNVPPPAELVTKYALAGHRDLAGAYATVFDFKSEGVTLVDFSGLPPVAPGRVYEVWLIAPSGRADPAGVFVPDSNGEKVVVVSRSLAGYSVMAVTNEPGPNGSAAPTEQPRLYGNI